VRHLIAKNELLYSRQQLFETTAKAAFYKNLIFLKKIFSLIFLCSLNILVLKIFFKKIKNILKITTTSLFRNMVTIAFQSVFHSEMHQNNIFLSLKLFLTSAHNNKKTKKYNLKLKKIKSI
jgi:hypothetical protein